MNARLRWTMGAAVSLLLGVTACNGSNAFTGPGGVGVGTGGGGAGSLNGTIEGTVTADGAGRGGVSVILVGRDSTVTAGDGTYRFAGIPAATYSVAVRVPVGFRLAAGQNGTRVVTVGAGGVVGASFVLLSDAGTTGP